MPSKEFWRIFVIAFKVHASRNSKKRNISSSSYKDKKFILVSFPVANKGYPLRPKLSEKLVSSYFGPSSY